MIQTPEVSAFITRWQSAGGAERANYQLFLAELCDLLAVPRPNPTVPDDSQNAYVFDRRITVMHANGSTTPNFIDLYKKSCFVLETKQGIESTYPSPTSTNDLPPMAPARKPKRGHGTRLTPLWNDALIRAKAQAEGYVRNLPNDNPPFLLVVDVGYSIETYADFSGLGKTYTPFPDALSHRIFLKDLADPDKGPGPGGLIDRLRRIWTDPESLNPARRAAKVTRQIAAHLADFAKSLEASHHSPESVAHFLMRCLFTLFAEDVGLIPNHAFTNLLESLHATPEKFAPLAQAVWQNMDHGGFSPVLREDLLRFNGGLFADTQALPLTGNQLERLIEAAKQDWSDVEPAIFGTLLERALHPAERHKLGAHYTPRAYVERLVLPTVIEPLREQWHAAQAKAAELAQKGKTKDAVKTVGDFLKTLCNTTVLDPACGSGNFLYVTMEHMKRLEGEVHDFLAQFPNTQLPLEYTGLTVDPHQLRGIELNPRAAAITDLVLWIGYLQWHFRTHGHTMPAEPVLKKFDNIECRDAVLAYDKKELARDEHGKPLSRWDGVTYKKHPITGEDIPDESARTPIYTYTNPRPAKWPKVDYVVGNPPFIGNKRMRVALGDGYVEALRAAYDGLPENIDFVMYWWNKASTDVANRLIKRSGLITTNSIGQGHSRHVLQQQLASMPPRSILFAIPDHPWVESSDGASVRIAMTVVGPGDTDGTLCTVVREIEGEKDNFEVDLISRNIKIGPSLVAGADVTSVKALRANTNICFQGMILVGEGFRLKPEELAQLGYQENRLPQVIRRYIGGKDLVQKWKKRFVIDLYGHSEQDVRSQFPSLYQRVYDTVRPLRMQNRDEQRKSNWWLFGRSNEALRTAISGLPRFIVTVETSKHKPFVFIPAEICPDHKLYVVASVDAFHLGVLSARVHQVWALAAGGTLEDRPTWTNTTCFLPFPFPACTEKQKQKIRQIAEELDAHRKRQQQKHPDLTLTDMYNVLEKLRLIDAGQLNAAAISPKDKKIHDHGLVSILKQLHDDLDAAVFAAYGWPADFTDDQLLERLVALNHERAAEEQQGVIRYLRPEFQKTA